MKVLLFIMLIVCLSISCTTKPEVIVIGQNTYYFEQGVENFYVVNIETGEKFEITK